MTDFKKELAELDFTDLEKLKALQAKAREEEVWEPERVVPNWVVDLDGDMSECNASYSQCRRQGYEYPAEELAIAAEKQLKIMRYLFHIRYELEGITENPESGYFIYGGLNVSGSGAGYVSVGDVLFRERRNAEIAAQRIKHLLED